MLISAAVALALFAAPETTQSGGAAATPAAEAKPATRKVCQEVEVAGSRMPKRKCREEPVKAAPKKDAEQSAAKDAPAA